jgi:putative membrane protein
MTESKQPNRATTGTDARTGAKIDLTTLMAGERTFLAWIRTGLALMGFGFVVARFGLFLRVVAATQEVADVHSTGVSLWVGTTLVVIGVSVNLVAAWQHARLLRCFRRSELFEGPRWSLGILVAVILALLGILMALNLTLLRHW